MTPTSKPSRGEPIRQHTFDGIEEYDKNLPRWWLNTFYATIVFAIIYWFIHVHTGLMQSDAKRVEGEVSRIQAAKLSASVDTLNDQQFWDMSRNAALIEQGASTYASMCASCHGEKLTGGIGPSLVDAEWLHGGFPLQIKKTVTDGVSAKGMPPWGPVLGQKKIAEVVAFILSNHQVPELATAPTEISSDSAVGSH